MFQTAVVSDAGLFSFSHVLDKTAGSVFPAPVPADCARIIDSGGMASDPNFERYYAGSGDDNIVGVILFAIGRWW